MSAVPTSKKEWPDAQYGTQRETWMHVRGLGAGWAWRGIASAYDWPFAVTVGISVALFVAWFWTWRNVRHG